MTIDEAIRYYEDKNVVLTEEEALANTIAMETMRKYQKIEQIVRETSNDGWIGEKIRKVLEDGNDK